MLIEKHVHPHNANSPSNRRLVLYPVFCIGTVPRNVDAAYWKTVAKACQLKRLFQH